MMDGKAADSGDEQPRPHGVKEITEIDRDVDLYFALLRLDETGGQYRSELYEQVQNLDTAPFSFSVPDEYAAFMENLRFLDVLGAIGTLRERRRITLTEKGVAIADQLVDALDQDQRAALEEASHVE